MPKIIVVTGGIGSGKSIVSQYLRINGYKVYDCDSRAKYLNNHHRKIISEIISEFGSESYQNGALDTKYLSAVVFGNKEKLKRLNKIVHPRVREDLLNWIIENNNEKLLFVETAILKESNLSDMFDSIILVDAPVDIRIERVELRNNLNRNDIQKRIESQNFANLSIDFYINNDNSTPLIPQINFIIKALTN